MTNIVTTITKATNKNNFKKYNNKYIKIGDEKLWKI